MRPVGHMLVSSAVKPVRKVWKPRIQGLLQRDLLCFFTAGFCILLIHTLSPGQVNYGEEQNVSKGDVVRVFNHLKPTGYVMHQKV